MGLELLSSQLHLKYSSHARAMLCDKQGWAGVVFSGSFAVGRKPVRIRVVAVPSCPWICRIYFCL